jgi:hypothetical protein
MRPLSKSKILAFRQCAKRIWLELHRPELREEKLAEKSGLDELAYIFSMAAIEKL